MVFLIHFYLRKFTIELLKRIKTFGFRCSLTKHKFPCHFFIFLAIFEPTKKLYFVFNISKYKIRLRKQTYKFDTQNYS